MIGIETVDVADQSIFHLVAHKGFVRKHNHDHALQQVVDIGRYDTQQRSCQRFAPAVEFVDLDFGVGATGDDLRTVQVIRHAKRPEPYYYRVVGVLLKLGVDRA